MGVSLQTDQSQNGVYYLNKKNKWRRLTGNRRTSARVRIEKIEKRGLQCPAYSLIVNEGSDNDLLLYEPDTAPVSLNPYEQPAPKKKPLVHMVTTAAPASHWALLALVIACSLVTWLSLSVTERFETAENLMDKPEHVLSEENWHSRGSGIVEFFQNQVRMTTRDDGKDKPRWTYHEVNRVFELEPGTYKLTVEASSTAIGASGRPVWGAHTGMTLFDNEGSRIGRFPLSNQTGDSELTAFNSVVKITETMPIVRFQIRLMAEHGSMLVKNPTLYSVVETGFYTQTKFLLFAAWALTLLLIVVGSLRYLLHLPLKKGAAMIALAISAVAIASVVLMLLPSGFSTRIAESSWVSGINHIFENKFSLKDIVSTLGHLVLFVIVGFITALFHRRVNIFFLIALIFAFALFTESIQTFSFHRTPSLGDIGADLAGGVIGFALGSLALITWIAGYRLWFPNLPTHRAAPA